MSTNVRNRRTSSKTTRRTASKVQNRNTSVESIENGIKIIQSALRKGISISAAAKAAGRGKNYVSDIKARIEENYKSRNISRALYSSFNSLNKQYEKTQR